MVSFVAVAYEVLNKCDTLEGHHKFDYLEDFSRCDEGGARQKSLSK